jgi:hypothetical protein
VLLFGGDDKPADPKAAFQIRKPVIAPWATATGGGVAGSFKF